MLKKPRLHHWLFSIRAQVIAVCLGSVMAVWILGGVAETAIQQRRTEMMDLEGQVVSVTAIMRLIAVSDVEEQETILNSALDVWESVRIVSKTTFEARSGPSDSLYWPGQDHPILPEGLSLVRFDSTNALTFPLDDDKYFVFPQLPRPFVTVEMAYLLVMISVLIGVFSIFAVWAIIRPLQKMSDAIKSADEFLASEASVSPAGAWEFRQLARVLNDMRGRIRFLLESRTSMMRNVSHDLRTPLTRLRLRAETIADPGLCRKILTDISEIDAILGTTLSYLRDGSAALNLERCDLANLLQMICDGFSDMGKDIAYSGPAHLTIQCGVSEITRAITNLCENGLKFGTMVRVSLERTDKMAVIRIMDNGPGIAEELREKVMEPYAKLDTARSSEGFGLGLSSASEIVARHGGILRLKGGNCGLVAEVELPL